MKLPDLPENESNRIKALQSLAILDTPPDERFSRLTRLAKRLFDVPIAMVSLVDQDRLWFKAAEGMPTNTTPRQTSFCGHAILADDAFVVRDTLRDERFFDNPSVVGPPFIRFYAGYPLKLADGLALGTLCIVDTQPREFQSDDIASLKDLAAMAENELNALKIANNDELTGLANRRGFIAFAEYALQLCSRNSQPATLAFIDLDKFKHINDQFGHAEGDLALLTFASMLKQSFRKSDLVARLGGDEFAVLLANSAIEESNLAIKQVSDRVAAHNQTTDRGYHQEYSCGLSAFDQDRHNSILDMLAESDKIMYQIKEQRRSR